MSEWIKGYGLPGLCPVPTGPLYLHANSHTCQGARTGHGVPVGVSFSTGRGWSRRFCSTVIPSGAVAPCTPVGGLWVCSGLAWALLAREYLHVTLPTFCQSLCLEMGSLSLFTVTFLLNHCGKNQECLERAGRWGLSGTSDLVMRQQTIRVLS